MTKPIIQSLLDLDFYKLTMGQIAWKYFRNVPVTYRFTNRTQVSLVDFIDQDQLREELQRIRTLRFTAEEIAYLRKSRFIKADTFSEDFLKFLGDLWLPNFHLSRDGGNYRIEVFGSWPETIFWETLILSVVNELYYQSLLKKTRQSSEPVFREGRRRLMNKINKLIIQPGIQFSDFGTRRRFSRDWQEVIVQTLAERVPNQFLGTSNVWLAKKFELQPIGTFAHELFMVFSGIFGKSDAEIRASHNKALQFWWQEYGEPLSVALTDTYGSDFFFRDFTFGQAKVWRGLRHDSGDPLVFGERAIQLYEKLGIDPRTKLIVFSDGLDLDAISRIHQRFGSQIKVAFGWGTNLTNDLGLKALSIVVKPAFANFQGTVKLSDNLAKAMGRAEDIERFKKIFAYSNDYQEECIY